MLVRTRAWDMCRKTFVPLRPEDTVSAAALALLHAADTGYSCAMVLDRDGNFMGLVGERDLLAELGRTLRTHVLAGEAGTLPLAVRAACLMAGGRQVSSFMNTDALLVSPEITAYAMLESLLLRNADFAVITQGRRPLGLVSRRDLFRLFALELEQLREEKQAEKIRAEEEHSGF